MQSSKFVLLIIISQYGLNAINADRERTMFNLKLWKLHLYFLYYQLLYVSYLVWKIYHPNRHYDPIYCELSCLLVRDSNNLCFKISYNDKRCTVLMAQENVFYKNFQRNLTQYVRMMTSYQEMGKVFAVDCLNGIRYCNWFISIRFINSLKTMDAHGFEKLIQVQVTAEE